MKYQKLIGIGTLSIVVFVIAIIFSFSTPSRAAIGDRIINYIGFEAWSNGTNGFHYTIIISIIFLLIAWFIGSQYSHNFGAVLGKKLSLWFGLLLSVMTLFAI